MQQEAVVAKETSQSYQLRTRLEGALGPLGEELNAGQIYVVLARLEKAGFAALDATEPARGRDRKIYMLTAQGHARVSEWLAEVSWPKPDLADRWPMQPHFEQPLTRRTKGDLR